MHNFLVIVSKFQFSLAISREIVGVILMRLHEGLISIVRVVVHQETTLLRLAVAAALGPITNQDGSSSLVMVFNLSPSLFRV